jgi:hypothetical protein
LNAIRVPAQTIELKRKSSFGSSCFYEIFVELRVEQFFGGLTKREAAVRPADLPSGESSLVPRRPWVRGAGLEVTTKPKVLVSKRANMMPSFGCGTLLDNQPRTAGISDQKAEPVCQYR